MPMNPYVTNPHINERVSTRGLVPRVDNQRPTTNSEALHDESDAFTISDDPWAFSEQGGFADEEAEEQKKHSDGIEVPTQSATTEEPDFFVHSFHKRPITMEAFPRVSAAVLEEPDAERAQLFQKTFGLYCQVSFFRSFLVCTTHELEGFMGYMQEALEFFKAHIMKHVVSLVPPAYQEGTKPFLRKEEGVLRDMLRTARGVRDVRLRLRYHENRGHKTFQESLLELVKLSCAAHQQEPFACNDPNYALAGVFIHVANFLGDLLTQKLRRRARSAQLYRILQLTYRTFEKSATEPNRRYIDITDNGFAARRFAALAKRFTKKAFRAVVIHFKLASPRELERGLVARSRVSKIKAQIKKLAKSTQRSRTEGFLEIKELNVKRRAAYRKGIKFINHSLPFA